MTKCMALSPGPPSFTILHAGPGNEAMTVNINVTQKLLFMLKLIINTKGVIKSAYSNMNKVLAELVRVLYTYTQQNDIIIIP